MFRYPKGVFWLAHGRTVGIRLGEVQAIFDDHVRIYQPTPANGGYMQLFLIGQSQKGKRLRGWPSNVTARLSPAGQMRTKRLVTAGRGAKGADCRHKRGRGDNKSTNGQLGRRSRACCVLVKLKAAA